MCVRESERRIAAFQARSRGWLVRRELGLARRDYEDVVREIEGELSGLLWRGAVIPRPRFPAPSSGERAAEASGGWPAARPGGSGQEAHTPERDHGPEAPSHLHSTVEGDVLAGAVSEAVPCLRESLGRDEVAGAKVSPSMAVDSSCSAQLPQMGIQRQSQALELPATLEELRRQRSSLAMELLWVQQAIGSRKKYLKLKRGLAAPVQ